MATPAEARSRGARGAPTVLLPASGGEAAALRWTLLRYGLPVLTGPATGPCRFEVVLVPAPGEDVESWLDHAPVVVWGGVWAGPPVASRAGRLWRASGLVGGPDLAGLLRHVGGEPVQEDARETAHDTSLHLPPRRHAALRAYLIEHPTATRAEVAARLGMADRTLAQHLYETRRLLPARAASRGGLRAELLSRGFFGGRS